ncbi:MAG: helix-turn-helix domain-containing protein [Oscillospiraceae bacterium]|nr:helix-turn-helix domain-containing protein [Oscillospiraceae bacterium]MCL2278602.1 helix-turn-helix domain-containing protein [Oscillospiraceae bacterium]
MKLKLELTLQEKLRDLRDERKLILSELSVATGIPLSTLQRSEGQDEVRIGYQDIATLAKFYDVSTDYLFGLTDNRQHRNVNIDELRLSDSAIESLKSDNFNHRLLSEIISHEDFSRLMSAIEIYVDRKIVPQMNTMNAMYKLAENSIRDKFDVADNDEIISLLGEAIVDEDEYLRYRVTERFSEFLKNLYDIHRKDVEPLGEADIVREMKDTLQSYPICKSDEDKTKWKMCSLAKQLGLNISELTDEEKAVLMKALSNSKLYKQSRRSRKRRR